MLKIHDSYPSAPGFQRRARFWVVDRERQRDSGRPVAIRRSQNAEEPV